MWTKMSIMFNQIYIYIYIYIYMVYLKSVTTEIIYYCRRENELLFVFLQNSPLGFNTFEVFHQRNYLEKLLIYLKVVILYFF